MTLPLSVNLMPKGPVAEVADLAVLAERLERVGGVYTTHMRDEGDHIVDAIEETVSTSRNAGVRVVISHHKCSGPRNYGRAKETLALIEAARRSQTVDLDVYPYVASSTVLLPSFMDDCPRILVTWSEAHPDQAGRDLDDICTDWGCSREEAAMRLDPAGAVYFQMDEDDLQRIMGFSDTMIGSDGLPHDEKPHPRLWGTFPRVLGHYARERQLFTLEQAVHKMTGLSAETFHLADRGVLHANAFADIVVFDPDLIADRGTFEEPEQAAAGIHTVLVNGAIAWQRGAGTGLRTGRILKNPKTT